MAWGTLVPKRELNPCPLQGKSLNHWTTREAWPASFRMQLASPFLPLNSALADVCRAKTPTPCFPTFISSNPVSLLLHHTCRVYFLRQFHRTLKLLRVNVKYAMVDTVRCFVFPQKYHNSTRRRGLTSQIHDTLSRHSRKFPPTALTWESSFIFRFTSAYLAPVPGLMKTWKFKTDFVMSEDLLAQTVGAHAISFWVMFLGFQACRKELGPTWGKHIFSGSSEVGCCCLLAPKESFISSCCSVAKLCLTLCNLMDCSMQGFLSFTNTDTKLMCEFAHTRVH